VTGAGEVMVGMGHSKDRMPPILGLRQAGRTPAIAFELRCGKTTIRGFNDWRAQSLILASSFLRVTARSGCAGAISPAASRVPAAVHGTA
jgi:hypothetical protein